ncbi:Gfo/Idh/MocA family protein [Paenibacillus nasutitermitis]|uniref:Oxidoreductase n=1 Tax=Paenibacillus nasutitermitis TaxID=1652958 RepID=A0A916YUU1_9BACL|nr:Gfo/Idh/MocA family oxidoreductase [Paenibacillus nasutitermitis]GGD61615.1 oxidoreductase [Paenibacillus nasutitermitis]
MSERKKLRIGMVGYKKMGKAHSQAYQTVNRFFRTNVDIELKAICGRDLSAVKEMARNFGWESVETDWQKLIAREDIDLIDVCAPSNVHEEVVLEAVKSGKHVFCEKPLALDLNGAVDMLQAAQLAKVIHMVSFNYRFVPAIQLARRIINEGRIGTIRQFRGHFFQDWLVNPEATLTWRLKREEAGAGALGDLGAHVIDLAGYLVGEISSVIGSRETFVPERTNANGVKEAVTVDDAFSALVRFRNGAMGTLESSRYATGRKCQNALEIYGSEGAILFDFQKMNELQFFSRRDDPHLQGFRTISATVPQQHPYADAWWGPGHVLGFESTFVHTVYELLTAFQEERLPEPNFADGVKCQQVIEAIEASIHMGCWTKVEDRLIKRGSMP